MSPSPPRRAQRRDSVESDIVKALRDAGYLVEQGGYVCDLIAVDPEDDSVTLLEVKSARGKLTPTQERLMKEGWPIRIVRSVAEAFNALAGGEE